LRNQSSRDIGDTTSSVTNDQANRFAGVGLCRNRAEIHGNAKQQKKANHDVVIKS
jgi:hypothetical protein